MLIKKLNSYRTVVHEIGLWSLLQITKQKSKVEKKKLEFSKVTFEEHACYSLWYENDKSVNIK